MHNHNLPQVSENVSRRAVLKSMAGLAAGAAFLDSYPASAVQAAFANSINPRWYGFNLLEYFSTDPDWMKHFPYQNDGIFKEDDFRWIRDWGFNWVRLPMDYRFWTDAGDPMKIDEKKVEPIDRAIRLGEKYGVHVNICLHRAPGYCILDGNDDSLTGIRIAREKNSFVRDQGPLDAFVHQWVFFAARYRGIANEKLSFNLVNEPIAEPKEYARVARAAIAGIRGKDPSRRIVTDGCKGGGAFIPELFDTGILQSCHDYAPFQLTHYHAEWARPGSDGLPVPTWPLHDAQGNVIADKHMMEEHFRPWGDLAAHGIPIHFGEMGCNRYTPTEIVHAWFNDALDMIAGLNSGWALWNFRGPFGILDTNRLDTHYTDWHGHQLDAELLRILQTKMRA
jgi:endoglucanase